MQPLAGEWAVRRDLFERLSVPTGYAVELAALIDTLRLLGPDAIAQVDLGRRAHRHQALRDLGAMATQILAASDAPVHRSGPGARRPRPAPQVRRTSRRSAARSPSSNALRRSAYPRSAEWQDSTA